MVKDARADFNAGFTDEKYQMFLADLDGIFNYHIPFRVAETPIFVGKAFAESLFMAANEIIDFIMKPNFKALTGDAIPALLRVPNETEHTHFLAIDFAVCRDSSGEYIPQLIELQGFPSLFCWEDTLAEYYRKHFTVPENFIQYFTESRAEYHKLFTELLLGNSKPENVVLLEIDPGKQGTAIDFMLTAQLTGIKVLHIGDVIKKGRLLYYTDEKGQTVQIKRIYNRIIFDEFTKRTDLFGKLQFNLIEEVDVDWVGHPNWFFRISKFIMPMLKSKFVPECTLLKDYNGLYPIDLENYVLKPLFSFSGGGVVFNCTLTDIVNIPETQHGDWMLQRKVQYEEAVKAADEGYVKPEIRLLFIWKDGQARPKLVMNLARLSRGEMIGVKYNKDKTWVGGSVALFER